MIVNIRAFAGQIIARVREARCEAGLSIEQIARSLSISTETFSAAERGDKVYQFANRRFVRSA